MHALRLLVKLAVLAILIGSPILASASPICSIDTGQDLQTTINQCSTTGTKPATIDVLPGASLTAHGAVSLYSNVDLRCEAGATIQQATSGVVLLSIANVSNVSVEGCTLNGSSKATNAINITNGTNIHITRNTIGGTTGPAIFGWSWHNVTIENSIFGTSSLGGWQPGNIGAIHLQAQSGASDHIKILNNYCNGNFSHSSCVKLAGSNTSVVQWIDVSHNQIVVGDCNLIVGGCAGTPGNGELGIELFATTGTDDTANAYFTIADNLVQAEDAATNNNAFCISLGGARYGSVKGNVGKDCQAIGIEVIASFVSVSNNTLTNTGPITWDANTGPHANAIISDNVTVSPVCRGVFLIAGTGNFLDTGTISNNIVRAPVQPCSGGPAAAALRIQGNGSNIFNVRVTDNSLQEVAAGTTAVETFGSAQIQIENNRFVNNHGTGLNLGSAGVNFTIKNNYYNGEGAFLVNGGTTIVQSSSNIVNGVIQ